jgi:hypothetical protein
MALAWLRRWRGPVGRALRNAGLAQPRVFPMAMALTLALACAMLALRSTRLAWARREPTRWVDPRCGTVARRRQGRHP